MLFRSYGTESILPLLFLLNQPATLKAGRFDPFLDVSESSSGTGELDRWPLWPTSVVEHEGGQSTSSAPRLPGGVVCLDLGVKALSFLLSNFSLTSPKVNGDILDCEAEVVMMVVSRIALEYILCAFSFCMMNLVLSIRPLKAVCNKETKWCKIPQI